MVHEAKRWFKPLARAAYASRSVIYAVIGFFAALAAIGAGRPMDSRQALSELLSSGAGSLLAYALVAALVCYALWRVIQARFRYRQSRNWSQGPCHPRRAACECPLLPDACCGCMVTARRR